MRKTIKNTVRFLIALFAFCVIPMDVQAAAPIDEITYYGITIDVNADATLNMTYHLDWLVLESEKNGPVDWVEIGIPNSHVIKYEALSDNVRSITRSSSGGESTLKIYFNDSYTEGETISFDFLLTQDYMYQMNLLQEGETVYEFTPGWFDDIAVDQLMIKWNNDKISSFSPSCIIQGDHHIWEASLAAGEKYKISVTYPNDAYAFKESSKLDNGASSDDGMAAFLMLMVFGGIISLYVWAITRVVKKSYKKGANFGSAQTKITRTKIVYFSECPHCAAARQEGQDTCIYCGTNLIKSEEVVKEETVKQEDQNALNYKKDGLYKYTSQPNTYLRVHIVPAPVSHARSSSCAHSSCACASHCACACACACAGGGRAGCSTKDFYNTNLKLRQLAKRKR